jgi:hypothetical protein
VLKKSGRKKHGIINEAVPRKPCQCPDWMRRRPIADALLSSRQHRTPSESRTWEILEAGLSPISDSEGFKSSHGHGWDAFGPIDGL